MSAKYLARSYAAIDTAHVTGSRRQTAMKGIVVTLAIRPEAGVGETFEGVSLTDDDRREAMHMVDEWLTRLLDVGHGEPAPPNILVDKNHVFPFLYTVFQLDQMGNRSATDWQNCLEAVVSVYTPPPNLPEGEKTCQEEILLTMQKGDYSTVQKNHLKRALPKMIEPELKDIIDAKLAISNRSNGLSAEELTPIVGNVISEDKSNKAREELEVLISAMAHQETEVAARRVAQLITMAGPSNSSQVHQLILQIKDASLKTFALFLELAVRLDPHFIEESKLFQGITWSDTEFQRFKNTLWMTVKTIDSSKLTEEQKQFYSNSQSELADVVKAEKARTFLKSDPSAITTLGLLNSLPAWIQIELKGCQWKDVFASIVEARAPFLALALRSDFIAPDKVKHMRASSEEEKEALVGQSANAYLQAMLSGNTTDCQEVAQLIAIAHGACNQDTGGGRKTHDILRQIRDFDMKVIALQTAISVKLKPDILQSELFRDVVCGEYDPDKLRNFLSKAVQTIRAQTGSEKQLWAEFDLDLVDAKKESLQTLLQRGLKTDHDLLTALQMYARLELKTTRESLRGQLAADVEKRDLFLGYAFGCGLLSNDMVQECESIKGLQKNVALQAFDRLNLCRYYVIPPDQLQKVLGYIVFAARHPNTRQQTYDLVMSYKDTLCAEVAFIAGGRGTAPVIRQIFEGICDQDVFRREVGVTFEAIAASAAAAALPDFGFQQSSTCDSRFIMKVVQALRIPKGEFNEANAEKLAKAYVSRSLSEEGSLPITLTSIVRKLEECGYLTTASALKMGLITPGTPSEYSLSNLRRVAAANARSKLEVFVNEANKSDVEVALEERLRGAKLVFHATGDAKQFDFTSLDALRNKPLQAALQQLALILLGCPSEAASWEQRILRCNISDVFDLRRDILRRFKELPLDIELPEPFRQRFVRLNKQASVGLTATQVVELESSLATSSGMKVTSCDILDMLKLAIVQEEVEEESSTWIRKLLKAEGHDDLLNAMDEGLITADILRGSVEHEAAAASKLYSIRNTIIQNVKTEFEAYGSSLYMDVKDQERCGRLIRCLQYDHFKSLALEKKVALINAALTIPHWPTCSTAMAMFFNNAEISSRVRHGTMTSDHGLLCLSDVPAELTTHVQYMQVMVLSSTMYNEEYCNGLDEVLRQYIFAKDATQTPSLSDCSRLLQMYVLSSSGVLKKIRQKGATKIKRNSLLHSCIDCYSTVTKEPETTLQRQLREVLPANVLGRVNSSELVKKILEATSELELIRLWSSLNSNTSLSTAPLYNLTLTGDEVARYLEKPSHFACLQTIDQKRQIGAFDTCKEFTKRTFTEKGAMRRYLDEDGKIQRQCFNIAEEGAHLIKHLLFQKENSSLFSPQFCELFMHTWAAPPNLTKAKANAWSKILMSLVTEKDLPDSLKDKIMASESTTELINSITLTKEFKTFEVESGLAHLETAVLRTMGSTLLSSSWFYPINGPGLMVSSATAQRAMKKLHLKPSELVTLIKAQPPNGPYAKMLTLLHNTISHTPTEPSSREHIKSVCENFRAKVRAMKSSENTFRGFTRAYRDSNGRTISPIVFWEWIITEIHKGEQPCPTASVSVSDLIQVLHWFPPTSKQDPLWRLRQVAYEVVVKAADRDGNLNEDFLRGVAVDCHMRSRNGEKGRKRKRGLLKMIKGGRRIDCTVTKTLKSEACWTNQLWIMLERALQSTSYEGSRGSKWLELS